MPRSYFSSSSYSPGQVISNGTLPKGVTQTNLGLPTIGSTTTINGTTFTGLIDTGPIVGLTASNADYGNEIFSIFTDFGTPAAGGIPARPGNSGIQGSALGELLDRAGNHTSRRHCRAPAPPTRSGRYRLSSAGSRALRSTSSATSRRACALTAATSTTTGGTSTTTFTVPNAPPDYGGSLFVSDLASGLYVTVTPLAPFPTSPILVPVQGTGIIGVTTDASGNVIPIITDGNTTGSNDFGGRIIRVLPDGTLNEFAYGFDDQRCAGLVELHQLDALDQLLGGRVRRFTRRTIEGIWQFKTTADLASSTSGTLVGLNDLRTLGVPYDGRNSAVAVVDTGVDASSPPFRGRVAGGTNLFTGGLGNQDLAASALDW